MLAKLAPRLREWSTRSLRSKDTGYTMALFIALLGVLLTWSLERMAKNVDDRRIAAEFQLLADAKADALEQRLRLRFMSLARLSLRWSEGFYPTEASFRADSERYINDFPELNSLFWRGVDGKCWSLPRSATPCDELPVPEHTYEVNGYIPFPMRASAKDKGTIRIFLGPFLGGPKDGLLGLEVNSNAVLDAVKGESRGKLEIISPGGSVYSSTPVDPHFVAAASIFHLDRELAAGEAHWKIRHIPDVTMVVERRSALPLVVIISGILTTSLLVMLALLSRARKLARRNYQDANLRLRTLIELLPTGVIQAHGPEISLNLAAQRILGRSPAEIRTRSDLFSYAFPNAAGEVAARVQNSSRPATTARFETDVQLADGQTRHLEVSALHDGNLELWILHDVTTRHRADVKFRSMFESASIPYLLVDCSTIQDCNPAALPLLGLASRSDCVGQPLSNFAPAFQPDGRRTDETLEAALESARTGARSVLDLVFKRKDGSEFQGELIADRLLLTESENFLLRIRDLTDEHARQARILHLARISSVGVMAAGAAHEINNPLTVIKACAARLQSAVERNELTPERIETSAALIEKSTERIAALTRGMLEFAGMKPQVAKDGVAASTILENVLRFSSERAAAAGVKINTVCEHDFCVRGPAESVAQIVFALVVNSCDALAGREDAQIDLIAEVRGGMAEIRVVDDGPGIPAHLHTSIFLPFFTTKPVGKGVGLGLSASKGIAETLGGELYFDKSAPRTTFVLSLPLHDT